MLRFGLGKHLWNVRMDELYPDFNAVRTLKPKRDRMQADHKFLPEKSIGRHLLLCRHRSCERQHSIVLPPHLSFENRHHYCLACLCLYDRLFICMRFGQHLQLQSRPCELGFNGSSNWCLHRPVKTTYTQESNHELTEYQTCILLCASSSRYCH